MENKIVYCILILMGALSCTERNPDGLLTVDVTANYPKKELILQDFMDVEYIPLDSQEEFLCQGNVAAIGEKILILTNMRQGDILIFDRKTGRGLKKINRKGGGPEEYILPFNICLNETENRMYVNDGPSSKIQVYDLDGGYERTISYRKGALVTSLFDFDADHFLSQDIYAPENTTFASTFFLMSKQDGVRNDIEVPFEERISPVLTEQVDDGIRGCSPQIGFISSYEGDWILSEPSADTIYRYRQDGTLRPFIVRTPSVQTMKPEQFLFPGLLSNRYYFMQVVKKECDFSKNQEMPTVDLVYDKQDKRIYRPTVYNRDYDKRKENMSVCSSSKDIAFTTRLEAFDLIEANGQGKLNGRLKEIASTLQEEDNPVIMLVKYKK